MPPSDLELAGTRILALFTDWLGARPDCACVTRIDSSGRFELIVQRSGQPIARFRGGSIQDAYAQAAQVLALDGDFNGEGP
jgi:hypothetical protein